MRAAGAVTEHTGPAGTLSCVLLPLAIALHPDASPATLQVLAAHPSYQYTRAAVLAHPALPEPCATSGRIRSYRNVDSALRLPHTTPQSRDRVLARTDPTELARHVAGDPDAHPAALEHLARELPGTGGLPIRVLSVLHHPALAPDVELVAMRGHLALREDTPLVGDALPSDLEYVLTRATAHPAHLADLAAAARGPVRAELERYAHHHATGLDPHRVRIADIRARATAAPGSRHRLTWREAVVHTGDEGVARDALERTRPTAHGGHSPRSRLAYLNAVTSAIVNLGRLRYTDTGYRAHLHQAGKSLPPARPDRRVDEGVILSAAAHDAHSLLETLAHLPHLPASATNAALGALESVQGASFEPDSDGPLLAMRLALQSDLTRDQRARAAAALTTHLAARASHLGAPPVALHEHLATAGDPTRVLLATPVTHLRATGTAIPEVAWPLALHLRELLTVPARDPRVAQALVHLAPDFTGTIAELLHTAATIAA